MVIMTSNLGSDILSKLPETADISQVWKKEDKENERKRIRRMKRKNLHYLG
jgi:ATP-dependent Clp protease ATP-binding subunit ClpA